MSQTSVLPTELSARLSTYSCEEISVGCSTAGVYRYGRDGEALYLKVGETLDQLRRERDLLNWLNCKLAVPEVLYYGEQDGCAYLLMTAAKGEMACGAGNDDFDNVREPTEQTVKALANGLLMLRSIDISDCPFDNRLDRKLTEALYNIENGLVDVSDWENGNNFKTPTDLYHWLLDNRPIEELCFTHGDFCLPNIFIDGDNVSGFIDINNGGMADKWQDIALCARSLQYNSGTANSQKYIDLLFYHLGIEPNAEKIHYYIMLDELF
jgi:kanamycin kinase/aminoglycoside 3'-phosphotransferase-3